MKINREALLNLPKLSFFFFHKFVLSYFEYKKININKEIWKFVHGMKTSCQRGGRY